MWEINHFVSFTFLTSKGLKAVLWIPSGKHTVVNLFIELGEFIISKQIENVKGKNEVKRTPSFLQDLNI